MTLAVIGAGLGRTGTMSLKLGLERLGFGPCYHMLEVLAHPTHDPVWHAATRGDAVDWDSLFAGYASAVDWPVAAFWRELSRHYPDAKFILSVREPRKWHQSGFQAHFSAITALHPPFGKSSLGEMRAMSAACAAGAVNSTAFPRPARFRASPCISSPPLSRSVSCPLAVSSP